MKASIITPDHILFKGECKLIQMPGTDGLFEIMDNHAPIIALLGKGKVKVRGVDGKNTFFHITGGVLKVNKNQAVILCE